MQFASFVKRVGGSINGANYPVMLLYFEWPKCKWAASRLILITSFRSTDYSPITQISSKADEFSSKADEFSSKAGAFSSKQDNDKKSLGIYFKRPKRVLERGNRQSLIKTIYSVGYHCNLALIQILQIPHTETFLLSLFMSKTQEEQG